MSCEVRERLAGMLGSAVTAVRGVHGGYSAAVRWVVSLADGREVFVKHAVDATAVRRLRFEHAVYQHLVGEWCPQLIGFEDGDQPLLVLEDLSACAWPPPWDADRVAAVRAALSQIAGFPPPSGLDRASIVEFADEGWPEVARDPKPFLNLGLCSPRWLDDALPVLLEAARPDLLDGEALCHLDIRSDNVCFRADGCAVVIDWDCAAIGNPEFDLAFWLPSLHLEGGPAPEAVADCTPGLVAIVAGFFAATAGLPLIPQAPGVRRIQRAQLTVALPWAARTLGLQPPH